MEAREHLGVATRPGAQPRPGGAEDTGTPKNPEHQEGGLISLNKLEGAASDPRPQLSSAARPQPGSSHSQPCVQAGNSLLHLVVSTDCLRGAAQPAHNGDIVLARDKDVPSL